MKSAGTNKKNPTAASRSPFFQKGGQPHFFTPHSPKTTFFSNRSAPVQTKLTVGKPNDKYEKEADTVADKVVQRLADPNPVSRHGPEVQSKPVSTLPSSFLQSKCADCEKDEKLQKKDEEIASENGPVFRKPIFESNARKEEDSLQKKCESCEKEDKDLQRKANEGASESASPSVENKINNTKGGGAPLPAEVNQSMSQSIGADFSDVRVHTDPGAAQMNKELRAQAFTHGRDIYFNEGKYDTSSKAGQHLLAHELTHTVQQGGASSTVNRAPAIQKEGEANAGKKIKDLDAGALKEMGKSNTEGYITKGNGGKIELHFVNFPSKQYVGPFVSKDNKGNEYIASPPFLKPTKERKTKQAGVWKKEALPRVTTLLNNFIAKHQVTGTEYQLKLKKKENVATTGTVDQIAKQVAVPFWGMDGLPIAYQIEHKVDWQIAGGNHDVDVISNLILLDAKSNIAIGQTILNSMRTYFTKVTDFYTKAMKVEGLTDKFEEGTGMYDIFCENLVSDGQEVHGSLISISNLEATATQTPFTDENIEMSNLAIPDGHFVLKTAKSGAGMFVPYNLDNDFIEIKGDAKAKKLQSITLKNVVKDDKGVLDPLQPNKKLNFYPDGGAEHYKVDSVGFATLLKSMFRGIKAMSPIEWTEVDFNPLTGLTASGEIKSPLSFLENVKATIEVENSEFVVSATASSDVLKGKLPKPFEINYSTLTISAGSKKKFTIEGEIGFEIENIGKGTIGAWAGLDSFGLQGKFLFENGNKYFSKAEIGFKYSKKEKEDDWSVTGRLEVVKDKIKGVSSGFVDFKYEQKTVTAKGSATLSIPGIDKIDLLAVISDKAFSITGSMALKKMKGIKSGNISITIAKEQGKDYSLSGTGNATPDIPAVPGLDTSFSITYKDGLFKIVGNANYNKGKLSGKITLGITNGVIDAKGDVQKAEDGAKDLNFFGNGSLTITLVKSMTWTLDVFVDPKGEILLSAVIKIHSSPFEKVSPKPLELFSIDQNIPLLGVPFANVFIKIGAGASAFFEWEPLVIDFETTLDKTPLEEIKKGKLGGTSTLKLHSVATAGVKLTVKVGAGVAVAVLALSVNISGSVGIQIVGDAGAELNAEWDTEKGLKFKDATFKITITPQALLELKGTIEAELDLLVSKVKIYTYDLGSAKKTIDIKDLVFKAELPVEFDDAGGVKKADFEKVVPKFDRAAGENMLNQSIGGKDNPSVASEADIARQAISQKIYADLKAKAAIKESNDIVRYAADLRTKYLAVSDPKLSPFILSETEKQMRLVTSEEFDKFKNDLLFTSKEPLATKLQRITEFESRFNPFTNKDDTNALRDELNKLATSQQPAVQKKPIFESEGEEKEEGVQRKADTGEANPPQSGEVNGAGDIGEAEEQIQRTPKAGDILPATDKQAKYYKYKDEVVDLLGASTFRPGDGLGNYVAAMWANSSHPAINVKVGNLGEGYIYVSQAAGFIVKTCVEIIDPIFLCQDEPPPSWAYRADKQVIPITHSAFGNRTNGTLVYVVEITNGFIHGSLGWIPNKKADAIDPILDVELALTGEEAFLPLIYDKEYDGANYVSAHFKNETRDGNLFFDTLGILQLPNQQKIESLFIIHNERYQFEATLTGKPEGLEPYKAPVVRTPDALITAEIDALLLDAKWTSGKADDEDGMFTASSQIRLSYRNRVLEISGTAKYASARFNGEVNITVTTKSKSDKLFAEHAAEIAKEKEKGIGLAADAQGKEDPTEPLALTAWGDLHFKVINSEDKSIPAGKKSAIENLEGDAAFVVSSDGFIILAGRVKLPTSWKLTEPLNYKSDDADDKTKHLFQHEQTVVDAWVPEAIGSIEVKLGITADADAHLDPLELYEIEIGGVYSNHPKYRSEINLTPKFFISGNAGARVSVSAEGVYRFLGLIKTASIKGSLTGEARITAYIDAAPTISKIWDGGDKAAVYGLSGVINTGGEITFKLTGSIHLEVTGIDIFDSEDYEIGNWTLKRFAVELKMDEYILGSGKKPNIDYSKMGMNDSQRHSLGQSITEEIEGKSGPDKRTGGFEQEEKGKTKETGTFSTAPPPPRPDHNKDAVDNRVEENFLMGNKIHDLVIIIGGTREKPTAILKMASGPERPLTEKIEEERSTVEVEKITTFDPVDDKRIDTELRDLKAIEKEAANIEKNAKSTAQDEPVKDPQVAGFDQIDDRITDYAQKYEKEDLGDPTGSAAKTAPTVVTPTTPPPTAPTPAPTTTAPAPATGPTAFTSTDLKKLKVGDLLSAPYKNGRARAKVLDITKDFVTILIRTKKGGTGDIKNMIPRDRFKQMLDDGDIFIWSELRAYLMSHRPKYVKGLVNQVWNNAIQADGKVRDPNPPYEVLTWHRSQSRFDQWHMGHKPKYKYSKLVDKLVNDEIDWDEFLEEYNTADNYYPELPSKNMGHGFESEPEE